MIQFLVSCEFYIKNIYLFVFSNFFFHFDKIWLIGRHDYPVNKWVMLGLKNFDPSNKHVGLVLTYVVEYS